MHYPENPALLAAVVADAEDDAPRLVYADWLEEHGDPDRAEFIRNQCALFDKSPAGPDYVDLIERKPEVLAALWRRDLAPKLPAAVEFLDNLLYEDDDSAVGYQRGFPYFARPPVMRLGAGARAARRLRDALPEVIATTTLRGLRCFGAFGRHLPVILGSPAAAHLSALAAGADMPGTVAAIPSSPTAPALRWLQLEDVDSAADADQLARATALRRLRRFEGRLDCPPAALRRLTAADWFGRLRRAAIGLPPETAGLGVAALAKLPDLHTLEIGVPREGLAAFAGRGRFPALGRLVLSGNIHLAGEGAAALGRARLPRLAVLELDGCLLRNADVAALAGSGLFDQLRVLSLANNGITDKGVAAVLGGPWAVRLRVLRLGINLFGKTGLGALARPGALAELTTLDLHSWGEEKATADDVTRFLTRLELPRLRHLDLGGWPVDDAGVKALARNPTFANLTYLNLQGSRAGPSGAKALFQSPHLRRLVTLQLRDSRMGKAMGTLAGPDLLPNLRECWVPRDTPDQLKQQLEAARNTAFL
jgi:uncharacterized protein (TIGR02996 family)